MWEGNNSLEMSSDYAHSLARLSRVSALSLDVYGTLLDLDAASRPVVAKIFSLAGVPDGADARLWNEVSFDLFRQFRAMETDAVPFRTIKQMFEEAYGRVLPRFGLSGVSPAQAAIIVSEAHTRVPPYPDTVPFLRQAASTFDMCVSSDADQAFLDRALANAALDDYLPQRVCSEAVRAYKAEPSGRFFQAVLASLGRRPEEVAHVGDGESDVIGAKRAGLIAVWVRRTGRPWSREDVRPDVVVGNLEELAAHLPSSSERRAGVDRV